MGTVTKGGWRIGSNILKVSVSKGEFVVGQTLTGSASNSTGTIVSVQKAEFAIDLRSYYDNLGTYTSDKGKVGVRTHKICLLYTSPSPRDRQKSRMPSSA